MITTVTLNAAIDKTYYLKTFGSDKVNRVNQCYALPGGKGINVARVIRTVEEPVAVAGIIGGYNGAFIEEELARQGFDTRFLKAESGESRICLNIISEDSGTSTEILEPGLSVSPAMLPKLNRHIDALSCESEILVFSGSLPGRLDDTVYEKLIAGAKANGAKTFLDTSGKALTSGMRSAPFFIKPNQEEVKTLLGKDSYSETELVDLLRTLMWEGIDCIAVTLGSDGALAGYKGRCFRVRPPVVTAVNTVGCGDSFVAGMAVGFMRAQPFEQILCYASALSAANALSSVAGKVDMSDVGRLLSRIAIEEIY